MYQNLGKMEKITFLFTFRSVSKKADFRDSVHTCSVSNKVSKLNQQLILVDKLRYFYKERVSKVYGDKKGLFRVNAIKFNNSWYEYDINHFDVQEVNFNHFEDFDVTQGKDGIIKPCLTNLCLIYNFNDDSI